MSNISQIKSDFKEMLTDNPEAAFECLPELVQYKKSEKKTKLRPLRQQIFEMQYQLNIAMLNQSLRIEKPANPFQVGELGEKWRFPSDHLPIGMSINDLHFANWNILNTAYLQYIEKNDQGLKNSLIMESNRPSHQDPRLTEREQIILEQVLYGSQ